jgi:hypothetical protein
VKRERVISIFLLLTGLGFAFLGQFYFACRRDYYWDGVLFWTIALSSLALLLWRVTRSERGWGSRRLLAWTSARRLRTLAAVVGICLALWAGEQAQQPGRTDFSNPFWIWLLGVYWLLIAFAPPFSARSLGAWISRSTGRLRAHWPAVLGLAALLLAALGVRAIDLERIPANLGGDEGTQGVAALELLGPPLGNPFATGWFSVPTMSFLAYGVSMRIFGVSVAGLRALSALAGAVTVLTTFLLARELWGRRIAWPAAIALACSHFHIHFSRLGSNQIFDGLFMTLSLWLLLRALRSKREIYFALAGAVIGAAWYGYFGARLVSVVATCYLAWRAVVEHRFLARYGRRLLILLGAALVVVAPLSLYYTAHPQDLMSRARQVNIFSSGWLAREQTITGRSVASLLLQQFCKSISAFNYTLDPTYWYRSSIPLLDFISGILFVLGLLWAMAHCRWPNNGLLLLWFWLALGLGWVTTENPPSSMRMTVVAPALAVLAGLGLSWLVELGQRIWGSVERRFWGWLSGVLLLSVVVLNLYYYFFIYTPTRIYGNPNAEIATELGRYLGQHKDEDDYVVYFYAPPSMYWDFGTLTFMARGVVGIDIPPVDEGESPEFDLSRGAQFVFLAGRLGELDAIREQYPGGRKTSAYSSADGRLLYVLYQVEK